jgi:hypothetical protein
VLGIDKNTVISQLKKKKSRLVQVNPNFQQINDTGELEVSSQTEIKPKYSRNC